MKYWINTIAKEHVMRGVAGGFTQANHGKPQGVKKLKKGDLIVFYSGKMAYPDGEPYQKFTAMGRVIDDKPYQVEMTPTFHPFRRNVEFYKIDEADIKPLITELSFIKDPSHWGFPFMRGLFEVPKEDFEKIAIACGASAYLDR
jgi:hypothetical protein